MSDQQPIRVVHLDPDGFTDLEVEQTIIKCELDDVRFDEIKATDTAIGERVGTADILLTHYASVPAEAMDTTNCSVIARYATGVDGIDVEGATKRGIAVTNVPTYCDEEVGEHVVALTLALLRSLSQYDAQTTGGEWDWQEVQKPRTVNGLTFGCFGFGQKAAAAANRAATLGFEVAAHDPYVDDVDLRTAGVMPVSFDQLVATSDVLSLHAPLTDETEGRVDGTVFEHLPEDAILINTARGKLVDEGALVTALEDGRLAAAGLDVFATEPPRAENPLLGRDDTIVTPHAAWYSDKALNQVRTHGTKNAIDAFRGDAIENIVNPEALANR